MKRSTIIALILAGIVLLSGFVLCFIGSRIADQENMDLFAREASDKPEVTIIESSVNRIVIDVKEADIHIIGGHTEQSISMIGFDNIYHSISNSGALLNITTRIGWYSFATLLTDGFPFDGLRFYTQRNDVAIRPQITLYLDGTSIRNFEISLDEGSISIENITYPADYTLQVKNGNVQITGIDTVSACKINIEKGDFSIASPKASGKFEITVGHGNIQMQIPDNHERLYSLVTVGGTVDFFGTDRGGTMVQTPEAPTMSISARTGNGDIIISEPENMPVSEPSDTQSDQSDETQSETEETDAAQE